MPQQLDIEKDPFLPLLTDALRAGPGSPQWHEAVTRLKTSNDNVDEYKLLIEAREALESGKDYRSVRAGPGFTRKLIDELDRQKPGSKNHIHLASLIALAAGLVLLAVIGLAIYRLYPRTPIDNTARQIEELASTYIPNELNSSTFEDGIPAVWRRIGTLPLQAAGGLKPGPAPVPEGDYIGGGVVLSEAVSGVQSMAVQASVHVSHSSADLIPQVFVSTDSDFNDRGVGSHELVWQLKGDAQQVVVNGSVTRQAGVNTKSQNHAVRLVLKGDLAIVECDGRRLWSGQSTLGDKPRSIGVRFLRTGAKTTGDVSIQSVRVLTTQDK